MAKEQFGTDTAVYNKLFYDVRGQLSEIRESTSYTGPGDTNWNRGAIINHYSDNCWGMCGGSNSVTAMTDNNGNLKRQDVYLPNNDQVSSYVTWADAYTYDGLNRLKQVHESTSNSQFDFQQEYLYDQWGNRRIHQTNTWGAGIPKPDFGVDTANNRLTPPAGYTMTYDTAGNLTNDTYSGQGQRNYDAENRMTQAWANSQWQSYTYDGSGQRIKRNLAGIETWQVFGLGGELLAEYAANGSPSAPQKEYGYRNGQLLITAQSSSAQNVSFTNMVGVSASGNNLIKTAASGWGNGGAVSTQTIASGDGYLEFTASETNTYRICGLSHGDTDQSYYDVDFNFYLVEGSNLYIQENATQIGWFGYYAPGDKLRVAVEGGVVKYRKNGTLLYTSTVAPTYPLLVDTALYNNASTLSNVTLSSGSGGGATTDIEWLVTDQLGTPRMMFDKTGTLANTKRHDYLPFGEELVANQGLRTGTPGYVGDSVRQHFTGYERDLESGLDYAHARYFSSGQGRFTGVDPVNGSPLDPQSWNGYSYVGNNPLTRTDPTGMVARETLVYNNTRGTNIFAEFGRFGEAIRDEYEQAEGKAASEMLGTAGMAGSGAGVEAETAEPQNTNYQCECSLQVRGDAGASLSPGNPLRFPGAKQTLGPSSLPGRWGYQVEESATVPDDVSTWVLTRTWVDRLSISYRDGTSSKLPKGSGSELVSDPSQPAGGHKLYALDAPGINKALTPQGIKESARTLHYFANFTTHLRNGTQHLQFKWSVTVNVNMVTGQVTGQFRRRHIQF